MILSKTSNLIGNNLTESALTFDWEGTLLFRNLAINLLIFWNKKFTNSNSSSELISDFSFENNSVSIVKKIQCDEYNDYIVDNKCSWA